MKKDFFLITAFCFLLILFIFCSFVFSYDNDITYELPVSAAERGPKRNITQKDSYVSDSANQNTPIQQKSEKIEQSDYIEKYSYATEPSENKTGITALTEYYYSEKAEATENDTDTYSDYSENNQPAELKAYDDELYFIRAPEAVKDSKGKILTDPVKQALNEDISFLSEKQTNATDSNTSYYLSETEFMAILLQAESPSSHEEELSDTEEDTSYIKDEQPVDVKSVHDAEIPFADDTEVKTEYSAEADLEDEPLSSLLSVGDNNSSSEKERADVTESGDVYILEPEEITQSSADIEFISVEYEENEPPDDADSAYNFITYEESLSDHNEIIVTDSKNELSAEYTEYIFNDDYFLWEKEEEDEDEISIIRRNITIPAPSDVKEKKEQNIDIRENLLTDTNKKTSVKNKEDNKTESKNTSDHLFFMKSGGVVKNIHIISKKNGLVAEVIIDGRPSGGVVEYFYVDPPTSGIAFDLYGKWKKHIPNRILFRNSIFSYIDVGLHEDRLRLVFRSIKTADYVNATVEAEVLPDMIRIYIVNHTKTNKKPAFQN